MNINLNKIFKITTVLITMASIGCAESIKAKLEKQIELELEKQNAFSPIEPDTLLSDLPPKAFLMFEMDLDLNNYYNFKLVTRSGALVSEKEVFDIEVSGGPNNANTYCVLDESNLDGSYRQNLIKFFGKASIKKDFKLNITEVKKGQLHQTTNRNIYTTDIIFDSKIFEFLYHRTDAVRTVRDMENSCFSGFTGFTAKFYKYDN